MAWLGYNSAITDVEKIVKPQPSGVFSLTSKPYTIADVETLNESQYDWINVQLRAKGITVPVTAAADVSVLGIINTYFVSEIILMELYKLSEQSGETSNARFWGDMGRAMLKIILEGKGFLSTDTTQGVFGSDDFGLVDTDIADEEPLNTIDYDW